MGDGITLVFSTLLVSYFGEIVILSVRAEKHSSQLDLATENFK